MGCLPCKFLRHEVKKVKQERGEETHPNAHELTTVTSLVSDPLEEITNEVIRVEEEIINNNSKLPGTIDDGHKEELSPLLVASTSQSNIPADSSFSLEHDQSEEDLQHAAILQSVVRAYIMRKSKLKEENTPFSELMVTTPSFSTFPLEDESSLLIPQIPSHFRTQLQQTSSAPLSPPLPSSLSPRPPPHQSLYSSMASSLSPRSAASSYNTVYPPIHPSPSSSSIPGFSSHHSQSTVYPPSQPFQVPILHEPIQTAINNNNNNNNNPPTRPLLANTLRHALTPTET